MENHSYEELLPKENNWLKKRDNGLILSDYHIDVLKRNGIDYYNYGSMNQILFEINDILETEENEELENIARELDERNYYASKKN